MSKLSDESLLLSGRWDKTEQGLCASAPAVNLQFNASATKVTFDIEGEARFRFDVDGKPQEYFQVMDREKKTIDVPNGGTNHRFRLIKISESNPGKICIRGIDLDGKGKFAAPPKHPNRRIEFIGDSFTVGYGNEGLGPEDGTPFEKTDASRSYAFLVADGYKADFQVNAVSGRGLVRNYAGIVPEWTLETLYDYTVSGIVEQDPTTPKWNFDSFHPQVVVIFVGINDFQGEPPYAEVGDFKKAYVRFLDRLRKLHPGVKFLLVSTKTWPNDSLTPVVQSIYEEQVALGKKDLEYKLVFTENTGLHGHPSLHSQEELANTLRPIIGRLGGFLSR